MRDITGLIGRENLVEKAAQEVRKGRYVLLTGRVGVGKSSVLEAILERLDEASPLLQGESQLGSMNAFGTKMGDYQILVVGEVPAATVQNIAASISYDPEIAKSLAEETKP